MQKGETRLDLVPRAGPASRFHDMTYGDLKRMTDLVVVALLLPPLSILMLLISAAIKLYSPGPVFYRQQRIGKGGVPFTMLKFRSMHVGSDSELHRKHMQRLIRENIRPEDIGANSLKLKHDPRITGLGRWLRGTGLDELPQVINVLRGEMSFVGPRPPLAYEYELYNDWHKQRMRVLPGITGLWQITAHNQVSFDEMVLIDLDYIKSMNLWLDLKIMVRTPFEMLRDKGGG